VAELQPGEKDKALVALMKGEDTHIGNKLLARFRRERGAVGARSCGSGRTVATLLQDAAERQRVAAEKAATRTREQRARREHEIKVARGKYLDGLAGRDLCVVGDAADGARGRALADALERERLREALARAEGVAAWRRAARATRDSHVLCRNLATVGIGAAQVNRQVAVEVALRRAGDRAKLAVMASDAYFPFPDAIAHAAIAGVSAIIQPGGSRRDEMAIEVADRHHLAMVFTGRRHFRH
jgi:hypothetical protein